MARRSMTYWLMKSEPGEYSIDDLERDGETSWEGVRNYQARNFMRDAMSPGDPVLFYHSGGRRPGVAGTAQVAGSARPDPSAFDRKSPYHDPKSDPEHPRWFMVDIAFNEKFREPVPLARLKADKRLEGMLVTRRGQRLSIQPVERRHFLRVLELGGARAHPPGASRAGRTADRDATSKRARSGGGRGDS
jgi:predicted RNA-binding protein with PUA-like domain